MMCTYDVCDEGLPVFCARYAYVLVYFFGGGGMYGSIYVLSWVQNVFLEGHLCKLCV